MVLTDGTYRRPKILIGKDTRLSSDMLENALTAGLCSVGANVMQLGVVPTPAVAYLVGKYKADAGIMISASHNPFEFNGIKIFSGDGYKLPDALEERIEAIVLDHEAQPLCRVGGEIGRVESAPDVVRDYVDHIKSTVPFALGGMKVAFDCANGSASRTAKLLFTELGAECHMLSDTPDGVNINTACGSTHMEALMDYVRTHHLDAGIAFDGDADRCLAVDENGNLIDGDVLMAICSLDMKSRGKLEKDAAVGTIMSNLGFIRFCEKNGIKFAATKVGDRYVLEEMLLERYNFGGEQSGHIIFHDFATGDGSSPLHSFSAFYGAGRQSCPVWHPSWKKYPQVLVNIHVAPDGKLRFYTDPHVKMAIEEAEATLGDEGRIVVRPSGTEPLLRVMVEGRDNASIHEIAETVAETLRERLGGNS